MAKQIEFVLAGVLMKQHLSGDQTGGAFSLFENKSNEFSKTPIHVHTREDERLYVMQGAIRANIAGEQHLLNAGESIFLPRDIPHQLLNDTGAPAHYLLLCTPAGFEGFLGKAGHALAPGEIPEPPSEPPRVYRRLQQMRRWSHEARSEEVFARSAGTRGANGVGTRRGVPIEVGGGEFDCYQDRVQCGHAA